MKCKLISYLIFILLLSSVFCGCVDQKEEDDEIDDDILIEYDSNTLKSRFGFMHPDDFEDMTDMGVFWQRPHPGPFIWGEIETSQGVFNWDDCDKEVKRSQKYAVNIIATIWPFADWDQSSCHQKISYDDLIFHELGQYRKKPCNMSAYQNFITKLVERYDGDGVDDMPGLVVPIKYWEVSNEPSMQNGWLVFFLGSAEEYFDILNSTYQTIKNADEDAMVLHGGMAGVMQDHIDFWDSVFVLGGNDYFDIGNIHSINSDSDAINGPEYKQFLDLHDINKSFWITEVEIGSFNVDKNENFDEDTSDSIVTNFVKAFASGAEKIFHPGIMKSKFEFESGKEDIYNALQTIIAKIDYFESVEKLNDSQYKFTLKDNIVYVIWGEFDISEEITGQIKMTDTSGIETIMDSSDLIISKSPVFIEII